jgi:hypothetical protein
MPPPCSECRVTRIEYHICHRLEIPTKLETITQKPYAQGQYSYQRDTKAPYSVSILYFR